MRICLLIVLGLACASPAMGGTIRLKSGDVLAGEVKRQDGAWVVTDKDGKVTTVRDDQISAVAMSDIPATVPDEQAANLASLRRSVEALNSIDDILARYQRFIESNPGAQVIAEAEKDVALWTERKQQDLVKFDRAWIAATERDRRMQEATALAAEAKDLLEAGRAAEAETAVQQALAADPDNAPALYLRGVMLFTQEQVPAARKAFEGVLKSQPKHGPTLANLAVILWRQEAIMPAVNFYGQAMEAAPLERRILNNVAEALEAIPKKERDQAVVRRTAERFLAQDRVLQEVLAEQGLYRWGATWVDQKQMDMLRAAEEEIQIKLDEIQDQFDRIQERIDRINEDIDDNEREMKRLRSRSYYMGADGRWIRRALPRVYYDIEEDTERLIEERDREQERQEELREQAAAVQSRLPVPRYTGVQQLLGPAHAPLPAATTRPTTRPTATPEPRTTAE